MPSRCAGLALLAFLAACSRLAAQDVLDYPLSWEARASQADYTGMGRVDARFAASRVCVPHTWHAAEMFLAVFDQQGPAPARPVGGP